MLRRKRGQRGFTLIELLIVVAILGVLAAVVIPNVGRFLGTGESAAKDTELHNIQSAAVAMMTDANTSTIVGLVEASATGDMTKFPDDTTKNTAATANKFALWDADPDDDGTADTRYVTFAQTTYCYWAENDGTVHQLTTKWTGTACQ